MRNSETKYEYEDTKSYPIYAVDFDGVLCENAYPDIGYPCEEVIEFLNEQRETDGATLILWTSRAGKELSDALDWCDDHGIRFNYVNENVPWIIDDFGSDSRKIYADYYIDDHSLPVEECREKSSSEIWAEREVEIATKDKNCEDENEYYYILSCYQSALKAYKSLCHDGHSGRSFGIAKQILDCLMDGKPLTFIEDNEEDWELLDLKIEDCSDSDIINVYLCKRYTSLFKNVYKDGTVKYYDANRFRCYKEYDEDDDYVVYHSETVGKLLDELYPITMPYHPSDKSWMVRCEEWLADEKNEYFDTLGIIDILKPDGNVDDIYRYFKYTDEEEEEISESEYRDRIRMHHEREDKKMDKEDDK